eukprot:10909955-Alexandrium_andersonii.AAC.1
MPPVGGWALPACPVGASAGGSGALALASVALAACLFAASVFSVVRLPNWTSPGAAYMGSPGRGGSR